MKKYFFIRHGEASPKEPFHSDMDDFRRELTPTGADEVRDMASVTIKLLKGVKVFYTSPLLRALQTAEIFHEAHPDADIEFMISLDKLLPVENFLSEFHEGQMESCAFVGHNPLLTEIVQRLSGNKNFDFAKAGVAVLVKEKSEVLTLTNLVSPDLL